MSRAPGPPRERIVAAAVSEFAARGVDATSIQRVADRAGMSKQALMHHFPSKELLRDAVYAALALRAQALLPGIVADLASKTTEGYRLVVEAVARFTEDAPDECRFILRELLDDQATARAWIKEQSAPWLHAILGVVEREQATERLAGFDAEAHVTAIAGLLLSVGALVEGAGSKRDPAWRRRVHAAALALIRRGSLIDG